MIAWRAVLSFVVVLLFVLVGPAQATLSVFNSQIVLDDRDTPGTDDDLYFFRDLTRFANMTYAEQLASIDALNTELSGAGPWQDNWHLALPWEMGSGVGIFDKYTDVPGLFTPTDVFERSTGYRGRYEETASPGTHHVFEVWTYLDGYPPITKEIYYMFDTNGQGVEGAWAVASRIPAPGSMLLGALGLGMIGRLTRGRRRVR